MVINSNLIISLLFCVWFSSKSFSQENTIAPKTDVDMFTSIRNSLEHNPQFYLSIDNKNSFISNRKGLFLGLKVGLEYNKIFRYGLVFTTLFNQKYSTYINGIKTSEEMLNFNYIAFFTEYIFKNNPKYEFSLPVNLGLGVSYLGKLKTTTSNHFHILYEAQLNGMFYPIKFIGFGAGIGYRIMFINNPYIDERFSAPIYSFKLKILFDQLLHL